MRPLASLRRRQAVLSFTALAALAALPRLAEAAQAAVLPGDSVYRLDAALVDQDGRAFPFSSLQGGPVLASMFYTSCGMVCPMVFETIHATLRALPDTGRAATRVLMVSFDPARDTPAVLKATAQGRGCDARWVLARADEATTRKLAAVLGVRYRRLANGEYSHSASIEVLDPAGRIVARSAKLGQADPAVTAAVRGILAAGPRTSP